MKKFGRIADWLNVIVIAIAVMSQDYFQSILGKLGWQDFYLLGPILMAMIGLRISETSATWIVEKSRWLRKILAGDDDIEGDWVNIVVDISNVENVKFAEFCRIRYKNGRYELTGNQWTLDGNWVEDFQTFGASYEGRSLEYYYRTGMLEIGGYGRIKFNPADAKPTDFICRYVDEGTTAPHVTRGKKVTDRLEEVSLELRRDLALKFAKGFDRQRLLNFKASISREYVTHSTE